MNLCFRHENSVHIMLYSYKHMVWSYKHHASFSTHIQYAIFAPYLCLHSDLMLTPINTVPSNRSTKFTNPFGFNKRDSYRDAGDENYAASIVVVVLQTPQDHAGNLENVERIQHLQTINIKRINQMTTKDKFCFHYLAFPHTAYY